MDFWDDSPTYVGHDCHWQAVNSQVCQVLVLVKDEFILKSDQREGAWTCGHNVCDVECVFVLGREIDKIKNCYVTNVAEIG